MKLKNILDDEYYLLSAACTLLECFLMIDKNLNILESSQERKDMEDIKARRKDDLKILERYVKKYKFKQASVDRFNQPISNKFLMTSAKLSDQLEKELKLYLSNRYVEGIEHEEVRYRLLHMIRREHILNSRLNLGFGGFG